MPGEEDKTARISLPPQSNFESFQKWFNSIGIKYLRRNSSDIIQIKEDIKLIKEKIGL